MNEGTDTAADRLARLGLQLPPPPVPVAAFEPYVRHGSTIYTSGQIATRDGQLVATVAWCRGGPGWPGRRPPGRAR